jgi:hypothetical protein
MLVFQLNLIKGLRTSIIQAFDTATNPLLARLNGESQWKVAIFIGHAGTFWILVEQFVHHVFGINLPIQTRRYFVSNRQY